MCVLRIEINVKQDCQQKTIMIMLIKTTEQFPSSLVNWHGYECFTIFKILLVFILNVTVRQDTIRLI